MDLHNHPSVAMDRFYRQTRAEAVITLKKMYDSYEQERAKINGLNLSVNNRKLVLEQLDRQYFAPITQIRSMINAVSDETDEPVPDSPVPNPSCISK